MLTGEQGENKCEPNMQTINLQFDKDCGRNSKEKMMIHPAWARKVFGESYKDRVALESGLEYTE